MPPSLARKTIGAIETALANDKTAAITEIIQLIQRLAAKAFSISISELSELIGHDPTITERLISSANTLAYNPTGVAVSTISDAIHTVGFEKIRNLAISLMLAENAARGSTAYDQRQAAALCVCSGMLASQLHRKPGSSEGSELVFVCASLRNYGRLLLSTFLVEDYHLAKSHALDMPEDEAFTKVFGLTPLELGQAVLKDTNLPRPIKHALRALTKELTSRPSPSPEDETLLLSELSIQLCSVVFDEKVSPEAFNSAIGAVLSQFSICYPLTLESVNEALQQVDEDIQALNRAVGILEKDSPASTRLQARLNGASLPQPPPHARIAAQLKKKPLEKMDAEERKAFSDATFSHAIKSIDSSLKDGAKVQLEKIFEDVCTAFGEAADLENCLIFVKEDARSASLSARYGSGKLFAKVKNRPIVSPEKKDIFSICLARREDILIQDTNAGKISKVVPEWIHAVGETSSFIILPVNYDQKLRAMIVGTVSNKRQIELSEADLKHLRSIRAMISQLYGMVDSNEITVA